MYDMYFLEKKENTCFIKFISFYETRKKCEFCNGTLNIKEKRNYKTPIKVLINNKYELDIFISALKFQCSVCRKTTTKNPLFNSKKEIDYVYFLKLLREILKIEIKEVILRNDIYSFI